MKGLLLKEFLGLKSFFRLYAIIIAVCAVSVACVQEGGFSSGFSVGICSFVGIMMCFVSFNYDEGSRWNKFVLTLPFTREEIVRSKYLFSLIMLGLGLGLGIALSVLISAAAGEAIGEEVFLTAAFLGACGLISIGLIIPLIFRFGVEKSRLIVILIFVLPFMAFIGFLGDGEGKEEAVAALLRTLVWLLPVCGAVFLAASYGISVRIYRKKEV